MNGWRVRVWARAAATDVDHEAVYEFDDPRAAISAAVAAALAQLATTPVEVQVRTGRRAFIVKRHTVETHPRGTIAKMRTVRKFSRWESVYYADTLSGAQAAIEDNKRRGGLYDYAVFRRGRKVWHA